MRDVFCLLALVALTLKQVTDYNCLFSLQQIGNITVEIHILVFTLGLINLKLAKMCIETMSI